MTTHVRPVADINITPLIDVMLVLLIIFMTVVPVARRGLDAALPRSATRETVSYARVVEVVDVARGAGADRIGLVPEAEGARPRAPGR